ncbi:MAG: hypothetical protein Q9219_003679 [cf. Caloplaca sp. 3 TL-2023]
MQKWNIPSTFGKSKPGLHRLQSTVIRRFSVSTNQSQDTPREGRLFRIHRDTRPPAIDARDLAAVPNPTPTPPGKSASERIPAERAPLDARNLGAQRPPGGLRIIRTSSGPRDDRGPTAPIRRDPSDSRFRGGASSAQHTRNRGGPSNAPRTSPARKGGAKDRPVAAPSGKGDNGIDETPSEEEIDYLKTQGEISFYNDTMFRGRASEYTKNSAYKTYTPRDITIESLLGRGPPLACGERGMSETVGERMIQANKKQDAYDERIETLAQNWTEGEFCRFRSQKEREDTMKAVDRKLAATNDNAGLEDDEKERQQTELAEARMKEEVGNLAIRMLKGDYSVAPAGEGETAELLERYTRKNETYLPEDRRKLAEKIDMLLGGATSTANTAKA